MTKIDSPQTERELMERATQLAGLSIYQLAERAGVAVPQDLAAKKGWVGQLLELNLGANAGSQAIPDFPHLGIELKTIPIDERGYPKESTYISIVPLRDIDHLTWVNSEVRSKLIRVLWIPVEAENSIPLAARRVGTPILWSPAPQEEAILRQDWEELMNMVALGELEQITATLGTYLQIRPKGANSKALTWGTGASGEKVATLPRGFYLRPRFTAQIVSTFLYSRAG